MCVYTEAVEKEALRLSCYEHSSSGRHERSNSGERSERQSEDDRREKKALGEDNKQEENKKAYNFEKMAAAVLLRAMEAAEL